MVKELCLSDSLETLGFPSEELDKVTGENKVWVYLLRPLTPDRQEKMDECFQNYVFEFIHVSPDNKLSQINFLVSQCFSKW